MGLKGAVRVGSQEWHWEATLPFLGWTLWEVKLGSSLGLSPKSLWLSTMTYEEVVILEQLWLHQD